MSLFRPRNILPTSRLSRRTPGVQTGTWAPQTYAAESTTDWIGAVNGPNPYTNALAPFHGEEVGTTTPFLQWPDLGATHTFEVKIYSNGGALLRTFTTEQGANYLLVPAAQELPNGAIYRWTVRSLTNNVESAQRQFYVRPGSVSYTLHIPGVSATMGLRAWDKILGLNGQTAIARPRILPKDQATIDNMMLSFTRGDVRNDFVKYLTDSIPFWEGLADTSESDITASVYSLTENHRLIQALAYYWLLGGPLATRAKALIKKRVLMLCTPWNGLSGDSEVGFKRGYGSVNSVDQTGSASAYEINDQKWRHHLICLALGYDLLKDDLTAPEKAQLLEFCDFRIGGPNQGVAKLSFNRALQQKQYESHGIGNIGYMSYACVLLAETNMSSFPSTYSLATHIDSTIKTLLPVWLHMVQSFRNDDGSSHSGCAYDSYDAVSNPLVMLTLQIFGIDLMDKPKYYNGPAWKLFMNGIPGTRDRTQFGDEAREHDPRIYRQAYAALFYRYPSPLNSYLYSSIPSTGIFENCLGFLPIRGTIPEAAPPAALSKVFPTGGYYGSLASFDDPDATHVLFRSSPHGGFNHAHHDMNGIVVVAKRVPLLIDSGYYKVPDFGSLHNQFWQRASRAHNTLSMDNGAGQQNGSWGDTDVDLKAKGDLRYWKDDGDYSCVIGDATQAYSVAGYTLASSLRAVVHFRDDVILTFDYALSSSGAHTWDWNFHTDFAVAHAGGVYTVTSGAATCYVQNLYTNGALQAPTQWSSGARTSGQYNYSGWDSPPGFSGTATSGTTTSVTLTGAGWSTDQFKGAWITVNGQEKLITGNTATTATLSSALTGNASGAFVIAPPWNPGPPSAFVGKEQYHHRISTAAASTEYKAVTAISVGSNSLIANDVATSSDAQSITLTATIQGRQRTVVFNYINKTIVIA